MNPIETREIKPESSLEEQPCLDALALDLQNQPLKPTNLGSGNTNNDFLVSQGLYLSEHILSCV